MSDNTGKTAFSPAEKTGIMALAMAFPLYFVTPFLTVCILSFFLLLCFTAPFFSGFGFFLPVISRGQKGMAGVALTFDDGPSASTPIVLDLLARHKLPATFFIVGEKAANHPDLIANILTKGHTIGNHSWRHDNFLMLRSAKTLQQDIHNTQQILKRAGIQALLFRPPVGITNPHLGEVLAQEGLVTVTYSCRALDRGNRNIHNLAEKILKHLQDGDIIMLHDLPPHQKNDSDRWQNELDSLFAALARDYNTLPLEQVIGRQVMLTETIPTRHFPTEP